MPLSLIENDSIARLELPGGQASADVLLYGATVISWKASGKERLFLSSKAALDGSSAVRGGIPLVFPVFGAPSDHEDNGGLEKVPRHGVARTSVWKLQQHKGDDGNSTREKVTAKFVLSSDDLQGFESVYQWPFELIYEVSLSSQSLTTSMHIINCSSTTQPPMRFQVLFHSYLRVPSALNASVSGLQGQQFIDKTDGSKTKDTAKTDGPIVMDGREWDAVFLGPAPDSVRLGYEEDSGASSGDGGLIVSRSSNCPNTTVWNPAEAKAKGLKDLHDGGWKEYVCIEPGKVVGFQELEAGKTFVASQTLSVA